jgi:hypothetical protein
MQSVGARTVDEPFKPCLFRVFAEDALRERTAADIPQTYHQDPHVGVDWVAKIKTIGRPCGISAVAAS